MNQTTIMKRYIKQTTTYYGQLAATHLDSNVLHQLPSPNAPTFEEINNFKKLDLVKAIKILNEVNAQEQMKASYLTVCKWLRSTPEQ